MASPRGLLLKEGPLQPCQAPAQLSRHRRGVGRVLCWGWGPGTPGRWGWEKCLPAAGGENPGSTRAPGPNAPLRFAHLESGAKVGGQGFAQSRAWRGSALTASRGAWRPLWVRSHSAPGSKVQGVHTQGTRPVHTRGWPHGHGRPFTSKAPYCTAAPVTEAWGPPGFAAPAVTSLSLRRVSGPGTPWEGPQKPLSASPATGPRLRGQWVGKLRQGLWWGLGEPPCCTSRWNWVNPGVSPLCSPLVPPPSTPPLQPRMLPRRGSAEARSFPKPCLCHLPPFADFIQKQIKEAAEGGGWVGVAPPSPCPCGGWHGGPEGLCAPWDPPGTRGVGEAQLGPVWPCGPTSGSPARVPGLRGPHPPLQGQAGV